MKPFERKTGETARPDRNCPVCGDKPPGGVADSGSCPRCLLEFGLSPHGSGSSTGSTFGSLLGDSTTLSARRFVRDGVLLQFGDYELLSEIARGGMGVVYRAKQHSLDRLVAVKLILAGQLATPESLERFRIEAQAAARLHHPGIVRIYEIGEYETQHFFSMELIDGVSLAECLHEFSVNPLAEAADRRAQELCIAELMAQVAKPLDFAHQHGVLHRDLKPSNILIDQDGQPHLTDFGLAKLSGRETTGLTLSNAVLGTPGYLAPEQAAGRDDITTAADIYGLGATLYELLTGRPPFVGANAVETMWMAIDQVPPSPQHLNPTVNRDLETIAMRCLERRPDQRYPSAAAVADELDRFVRHEPIQARPVSQWEHLWRWCNRNPGLSTMAGCLMLAILIGSTAALWQWRRAERANVTLTESVGHLEWGTIDDMLQTGESSRALAKVASLIRDDPTDWKAAMFGMSVMEQRSFPVPVAPPIRHPQGAELSVARISPDGQRVVTASFDRTARLWDAATSRQILPELIHQGAVTWAEFSPDGRLLATCSEDKTARVWDTATGQAVGEPLNHTEGVVRVHFSSDGRYLMTRTDRTVTIYDAADRRLRWGPLNHDGRIVAARFLSDGVSFFTAQQAGKNSLVQAWNLETGEQRVRLETGPLAHADINSDLSRAVTTDFTNRAGLWDVASGEKLREIISPNGELRNVVFNPRGDRLAMIGLNHWARVWDTQTGLPITPELPHYFLLRGVAFQGSDDRLLTWGDDALAQVWDTTTGEHVCEPMRHSHRVQYAESGLLDNHAVFLTTLSHLKSRSKETQTGAAQLWQIHDKRKPISRTMGVEPWTYEGARLSPDGKLLALGKTTQEVWVLKTATGEPVCGPLRVDGGPWGILFTPDARRLITTTSRGQVAVWSLPSGELLGEPVKLPTAIQPAAITDEGKYFGTGSTDGFVRLWDSSTGQPVWKREHGSEINSVGFSPDGRLLASAGEDRVIRIWGVPSGELIHELKGHQNEVMRVVFSPDNRRVLTASQDFTARIWDVASGQQVLVLRHQGEVLDAAFSSDGRYAATGARDRTAKIWDANTGLAHVRSLLHEQSVRNVRFSPDGQRLFTLDFRGLRVWDVRTGHPLTVHLSQILQGGTGFQAGPSPQFTPDGDTVFIAFDSPESLLWHVPVPPATIPPWFPEFLEAVAGQRFVVGTDIPGVVPAEKFLELRQRLLASPDTDYYTRWAQRWLRSL